MNCLVCNSSNVRELKNPRRIFFRCADCGFSFLHPAFLPSKDAALARYTLHQNDDDNKGYQEFLRRIIERALFYAGKPEKAVDCLRGEHTFCTRDRTEGIFPETNSLPKTTYPACCRVVDWGSGPNPAASAMLREKGFFVFSWDPNFSAVETPQKSFYDLGICIEVAEHFFNPQKDFSAFFETLKPGAFAMVHTHLAPSDNDAFLRWWYTEDITHVSYYSKCSLELLGEKNGAKIIAIEDGKLVVYQKMSNEQVI
jgi:hypothetical protein